ncbi:PREDICTED: protein ROS1 isoform X2 [Tarenaya hassleriana]|nr:PREDICTED: protein ROS1 isoform X2 [Tarenaya hassleriana]
MVRETPGGNPEPKERADEAATGSRESQCITENWEPVSELSLTAAAAATTASVTGELSNKNENENGVSQGIEHIKTPEKPKRRKHRPKVIKEAKPKREPKQKNPRARTPKPADGQEKRTAKRKYVRKKGVDKGSESQPLKAAEAESADAETSNRAKKSCRRALDFEDTFPEHGNESNLNTDVQSEGCRDGENQLKTARREAVAHNRQVDGSPSENQVPNTPLPSKSKPKQRKRNSSREKKQVDNGTNVGKFHHGPAFIPHFTAQYTNSVFSNPVHRQGKESASGNLTVNSTRETDLSGIQYDNLHDYQNMSWLYFLNMEQKKITPGDQGSAMSSTSCSVSGAHNMVGQVSASNTNCYSFNRVHNPESIVSFDQKETSTKKRSTTINPRLTGLASIDKFIEDKSSKLSGQLPTAYDSRGQRNTEAVPEMQLSVNKKRRTKKQKSGQMNQEIFLQNHYQFSSSATGIPPDELWKQKFSIEAITEQLRIVDINRTASAYASYQENALAPYTMRIQENNALVLYGGDGTIVPYMSSRTLARKQRPRPRVQLDDETNRVWELLMENVNNDGINGTDDKTTKWWEEERRVFKGRADSFIARMHLVQGDRRFTPWKGSVVDSVVGVFLTQNVSDHLSSSAFMSIVARFPAQASNINLEEGTSLIPREPVIYFDSEESMSTRPIGNQNSITEDNVQHKEEKESVNSGETSRSSSEIASSTHEAIGKVTNSSVIISEACSDPNPKISSMEVNRRDQTFLIEDCMPTRDPLPCEDSVFTSQSTMVSVASQDIDRMGSCSVSQSKGEDWGKIFKMNGPISFMELLQLAGTPRPQGQGSDNNLTSTVTMEKQIHIQKNSHGYRSQSAEDSNYPRSSAGLPKTSPGNSSSQFVSGESEVKSCKASKGQVRSPDASNEPSCGYQQDRVVEACHRSEMPENPGTFHSKANIQNKQKVEFANLIDTSRAIPDVTESISSLDNQVGQQRAPDMDLNQRGDSSGTEFNLKNNANPKSRRQKVLNKKKDEFDWDSLRREAAAKAGKRERTSRTMDSVDWEAVRTTNVDTVANAIKERGMNNVLAGRIQDFLTRVVRDHGSIDLEWLRDVPPDKAKEYLLSFRGLGLKSVECVRLLTLHHLAFPVDTNVGRIAVRLGWVPLQPLPESLQLHLLELYPILESIQKYLWPRLCKLDQKTLYELHYQLITFGKVFCTKSRPNCNACPMRGECRHFASAFASARLALPGTEETSIVSANANRAPDQNQPVAGDQGPLFLPEPEPTQRDQGSEDTRHPESTSRVTCCEPIIEEPSSPEPEPEPEPVQVSQKDIEDAFYNDTEEIPTLRLNTDAFTNNLKDIMQHGNMSKALVALTEQVASIPMPKLKSVSQLRTEHHVYELPDSHPLLVGLEKREPDDPCSYLLAIWTPGETVDSIQPPESKCSSHDNGTLCNEETCFSCNSTREARSHIVRGTILIPCRTAMKGSFPLNGTYFQVNEVFADHESSQNPIDVPRDWIWNLSRKTVYFGTSIPSIFRGLTTERIQHCFWRGYVCVRGFDRKTRAPRPLIARLHFPVSKIAGRGRDNRASAADGR